MLIDWFTVVAQVLNFLVLVWLMKRYLYKPILQSIDAREKKIAAAIADANLKKTQAQNQSDVLKKKNQEFDDKRAALLAKATSDAASQSEHLIDQAKANALALGQKNQADLKAAEQGLHDAMVLRMQNEVFSVARKALKDLSDASLEERIVRIFVRRISELSTEEKEKMSVALTATKGPLIIHSATALDEAQTKLVEKAIRDTLGTSTPMQFETAPDLIGGIELVANGKKVAWTIANYLETMRKSLVDVSTPARS